MQRKIVGMQLSQNSKILQIIGETMLCVRRLW